MINIYNALVNYVEAEEPPPNLILKIEDEKKLDLGRMKQIGFKKQKDFWAIFLEKAKKFVEIYQLELPDLSKQNEFDLRRTRDIFKQARKKAEAETKNA